MSIRAALIPLVVVAAICNAPAQSGAEKPGAPSRPPLDASAPNVAPGGYVGGGVYRVGGDVLPPRPISTPDPDYSDEARRTQYEGSVYLNIVVGPDGRVQDAKVDRPLGLGLDEKALTTVQDWRFQPATKSGEPVAVQLQVQVNFATIGHGSVSQIAYDCAGSTTAADIPRLTAAAESGDRRRQLQLGCFYWYGRPRRNLREAYQWLTRAAEQGSGTAALLVGFGRKNGMGTAHDDAGAYFWFRVAQQAGVSRARQYVSMLTRTLPADERSSADVRLSQWLVDHKLHSDLP